MDFKIKLEKKDSIFRCQKCEKSVSGDYHPCPFDCEINDNCDDVCNCCPDCEHECAMDI